LRVYGCQAKLDQKYLQNLIRGVKTNLRKIADEGVFSLFENFSIKDN